MLVLLCGGVTYADDVLWKSLETELQRSAVELRLPGQLPPYYIGYRVNDVKQDRIVASFGGLLTKESHHNRYLRVALRVGDRSFDNGNFICPLYGSSTTPADFTGLPLEDDEYALRQSIWLVTDGTYKKALAVFARKQASIQNQQPRDTIPDFAPAAVCTLLQPLAPEAFDEAYWQDAVAELSGVFRSFPQIRESRVELTFTRGRQYWLDTDLNRSRRNDRIAALEVYATTQRKDGTIGEEMLGFYAPGPDELDMAAMLSEIRAWADTLCRQSHLEVGEGYSGPVLFLDQAAAELVFHILGKGIADPRAPRYESEAVEQGQGERALGGLADRFGHKVTARMLSVHDDAGREHYQGRMLVGHYAVDDEGVVPQRVNVVTDGKLTGYYMSRTPTKQVRVSNGHGRNWLEPYGGRIVGMPANMIIESSAGSTRAELLDQLISLAREYGNTQALIVTRLRPSSYESENDDAPRYARKPAEKKPLLSPAVTAYLVDVATRKMRLCRGMDFSSVTGRVLRDIVATGDRPYVYNVLYRERDNAIPVSVVTPALLVDDLDLVPRDERAVRPPIIKHPFFK